MAKHLELQEDAAWKQRFRAPVIWWTQQARRAPERGLLASNASGVGQLYSWTVPTGEMIQLTFRQEGKGWGVLSPDGAHVYYLDDEQGNEIGHWARKPFEGGTLEDITPDMAPYSSWGFYI